MPPRRIGNVGLDEAKEPLRILKIGLDMSIWVHCGQMQQTLADCPGGVPRANLTRKIHHPLDGIK